MKPTILSVSMQNELIHTMQTRFATHMYRHPTVVWEDVQNRLQSTPNKLWSLQQMELTGGEPDVFAYSATTGECIFMDFSTQSPVGRRSLCYDQLALDRRKENKPVSSAQTLAADMGISLLTEEEYRQLQQLNECDMKTSSWIVTPESIRTLGGALFCDRRYNTVFTYHNGADSYYAARGFRAKLLV